MKDAERLERRATFGEAVDAYDAMRPGYPPEAIASALRLASLVAGERLLEIGCGTGQATESFAESGLTIVALEPDPGLAARARQRLGPYPSVSVVEEAFETFTATKPFDPILAATSFHWIDPTVRVARCRELVRQDGQVILLANLHPKPYTGFFVQVQSVYERIVPEWGRSDVVQRRIGDSQASVIGGLEPGFQSVGFDAFEWMQRYDADEYLQLLSTYSDHRRLPAPQRERLFGEIRALIVREFGGTIERPYRTILHVLQRAADGGVKS